MTPAERLLDRLECVRSVGDGKWQARCPSHDDRTPSLSITVNGGGDLLIHCHAGCPVEDIVVAMGLEQRDLFADSGSNGQRQIVAEYDYPDERGELLYQAVRFDPKGFSQRRPDGNGGWVWNLKGTRRVLYRFPEVLEAVKRDEDVMVVEGEKDVHALEKLGIAATCNPGGAGKWRPEYSETLRGAKTTIVADRDEPGREHARQVAESLDGVAAEVDVVEPARGKDVAELIAIGGSIAELVELPLPSCQTPMGAGNAGNAPESALESQKPLPDAVGNAGSVGNAPKVPGLIRLDVARMLREPPPPIDWTVEKFLARGYLGMLSGKEGEGKSLLSMAIAAGVALGESIAGLSCQRGKVIYIDGENGKHEIHRRLHSLGLPADVVVFEANSDFDLRSGVGPLERLVRAEEPTVVVFDSFRSLWAGDENSSGEASAVLDPVRRLCQDRLVGGLMLHHSPRGRADYRGSSAIGASIEIGFMLGRAEGDPDQKRRYLQCHKCRPAAEPERRWIRLAAEAGMVFVEPADAYQEEADTAPPPAVGELGPRVLKELRAGPAVRADIARRLGRKSSDNTIRRTFDFLAREGRIRQLQDGCWALPDALPSKGFGNAGNGSGGQPDDGELERLRAKFPELGAGS